MKRFPPSPDIKAGVEGIFVSATKESYKKGPWYDIFY